MSANVWDQVLTKVEAKINRHSFYTWFKPTSFIADDGHALTIRVPNPLFKDWLTKHYAVVLSEALRETGPARRRADLPGQRGGQAGARHRTDQRVAGAPMKPRRPRRA